MHAAQASDNVPARYDRARLRRPTTPLPRRGRPIGLGADLSVTAAEPATEMTSVAAVAPARAVTTPPTYLQHCLRRLADGSRPPTPEGSLPPFGRGDVAPLIGPATGRPSLPPSSFTRSPMGSPCGSLSPKGGLWAYHVAPLNPRGLGPASTPVARHLRRGSSEPPDLATYLLVQACQHLGLVLCDGAYGGSPGLTIPRTPGPQPPWCWQSRPWLA